METSHLLYRLNILQKEMQELNHTKARQRQIEYICDTHYIFTYIEVSYLQEVEKMHFDLINSCFHLIWLLRNSYSIKEEIKSHNCKC